MVCGLPRHTSLFSMTACPFNTISPRRTANTRRLAPPATVPYFISPLMDIRYPVVYHMCASAYKDRVHEVQPHLNYPVKSDSTQSNSPVKLPYRQIMPWHAAAWRPVGLLSVSRWKGALRGYTDRACWGYINREWQECVMIGCIKGRIIRDLLYWWKGIGGWVCWLTRPWPSWCPSADGTRHCSVHRQWPPSKSIS